MDTIDYLSYATLTTMINAIRSPRQFLRRMLFSDHRPVTTDHIEFSVISGGRDMAPFVKKNASAIMVKGYDEKSVVVEPPNIRIKRPMSPEAMMFRRMAGTGIFADQGQIEANARLAVARDAQRMADMITVAEEWLCSQAIRGVVNYVSADEDAFQIDYGRLSTHIVTLTGAALWSASTSDPAADFLTALTLASDDDASVITDVILGANAASAFVKNAKVLAQLAAPGYQIGSLTMVNPFDADGAVLLSGSFGRLRVWQYGSKVTLQDGTSYDLIRPDYAEFVTASPAAENVMYYGAIADIDALQSGRWVGERFSKSWTEKDPSALMQLATSRPLPVLRHPNSTVSMKVV